MTANIKIAILSQNSVNRRRFIEDIDFFGIDQNNKPDIYVEMTQEDSRMYIDSMVKDPTQIVKGKYTNIVSEIKRNGNNIVTNAFISNVLLLQYNTSKGNIIVNNDYGNLQSSFSNISTASKGASYIKLTPKTIGNISILFINMHLPDKTVNSSDLIDKERSNIEEAAEINSKGDNEYQARKTAFKLIIDNLSESKVLDDKTDLIIGGNLNFRVRYGHFYHNRSETEIKVFDELTEYLKERVVPVQNITELGFPQGSSKNFTCALNPDVIVKENLAEPQEIDENKVIVGNDNDKKKKLSEFIRYIESASYAKKEINPSRCDRFLTNFSPREILKHGSTYFNVLKSDHQAIYAMINVFKTIGHGSVLVGGNKKKKNRKTKKSSKKRRSKLSRRSKR